MKPTKQKQGTNPGILLNSAPRGHNIDNKIEYDCEVYKQNMDFNF